MTKSLTHKGVSTRGSQRRESELAQEGVKTPLILTTLHCRKISTNKRYYGGMLLFIRRSLRKGVKVNNDIDDDCIEVTLNEGFFGLEKSVRILFTYASPLTSSYTRSRSRTVLDHLETFINDGRNSVLVMGDLNGKTRTADYFVRDSNDEHSPIIVIPL